MNKQWLQQDPHAKMQATLAGIVLLVLMPASPLALSAPRPAGTAGGGLSVASPVNRAEARKQPSETLPAVSVRRAALQGLTPRKTEARITAGEVAAHWPTLPNPQTGFPAPRLFAAAAVQATDFAGGDPADMTELHGSGVACIAQVTSWAQTCAANRIPASVNFADRPAAVRVNPFTAAAAHAAWSSRPTIAVGALFSAKAYGNARPQPQFGLTPGAGGGAGGAWRNAPAGVTFGDNGLNHGAWPHAAAGSGWPAEGLSATRGLAQPPPAALSRPAKVGADMPPPADAGAMAEIAAPINLQLVTHQSLLVQSPAPLTQVSVADDAIAQVSVVSPHQVLVQGKAPGTVSMLLWDDGHAVQPYTVHVGLDPEPLRRTLSHLFPQDHLRVTASGDALVLGGTLTNAADAQRALAVAAGFATKVVNDLNVNEAPDPPQVLLQVRFAEVNRSAALQLGANLVSTGKGMVGSAGTQQFGPPAGAVAPPSSVIPPGSTVLGGNGGTFGLSDLLNVFLFSRSADLGLTLEALEQKNLLQILAEPNLLAMNGKEASFLAGGEFPFPVVQGQGAINNVTIQFKPFGVNLHFTPTVLRDGTIDLKVAPEVSALDFSNALTVSGFRIPALSTRKAQTELELADGQSFVIAGLMDNRLTNTMSKVPGLGDIPILGAFFRSREDSRSQDELMVVVTVHLVKPSAVAPPVPRMPVPFLNPDQFDHPQRE